MTTHRDTMGAQGSKPLSSRPVHQQLEYLKDYKMKAGQKRHIERPRPTTEYN